MGNLEKALSEVIDLVKHLVGTHVHWNVDLSKDEAVAKVEAARVALLANDVSNVISDAEKGDVQASIVDLEKALADAKALANPVVADAKVGGFGE